MVCCEPIVSLVITLNMDVNAPRTALYPELAPYNADMLELDGRHRLYFEESGNPHGAPVVFLHGGPGAGASPAHRRFFDPAHYRIVIFDQRGAGRSATLKNCARTWASNAGWCSADRGAARWRWSMPKHIRSAARD